ncbi:hypothetical protein DAPPUDRAFT_335065 [Daphnia pulex]|uniref:Uncharacterized protein n=1 Tax=Daphnia pulex TaxID=6669 RepID=E9HX00_DAPPU|nr:hypothetical protein DAPPUDRAFT_335065 [Daphnia pulex]|eukprot:EFX63733.1 hypothetical protein DAPPUDRAFT_335065 [Daphnia pulex]
MRDEDFDVLNKKINSYKPQGKNTIGAQKCGNSQFEAAREVSKRFKGLEVTGNVMTSCGHGVIQCSIDMHEGETFRHTFASHVKVHSLKNQKQHKNLNITETEKNTEDESANTVFFGPKFFVNDVVCQYWPFAIKMGELSEAYSYLTSDMVPFLSRLHGQAHSWPCQILHFGHWRDGSAGTLGEEQEQVFSTFSSYSNSTKTMGAANRRDFLTGAMCRKQKGMARTLTRRMLIV